MKPHPSSRPARFLVAPLDWGLGHATRCVPVIRTLLDQKQQVLLAGQGKHIDLLREEFPSLEAVPMVSYAMRYAPTPLLLQLQFPLMVAKVMSKARREQAQLHRIVARHNIDAVISDQRFGCHHPRIPSIYISHQLCVLMPAAFGALERLISRVLRNTAMGFDELWIPDYAGAENLTGDLTRKYPLPRNARFVGPLSRFTTTPPVSARHRVDLLVLLSGPEPQRSRLESLVLEQLHGFKGTAVVLRGKPEESSERYRGNGHWIVSHLDSDSIAGLMAGAKTVVCRGGYSTIMDLISIGARAALVPTPGQTEQEYLCKRLARKGRFAVIEQRYFSLAQAMAPHYFPSMTPATEKPASLAVAIDNLRARVAE